MKNILTHYKLLKWPDNQIDAVVLIWIIYKFNQITQYCENYNKTVWMIQFLKLFLSELLVK